MVELKKQEGPSHVPPTHTTLLMMVHMGRGVVFYDPGCHTLPARTFPRARHARLLHSKPPQARRPFDLRVRAPQSPGT